MKKAKKKHEKYWDELGIEQKRDMMLKYYPNPQRRWPVDEKMKREIYKKEVLNKPIIIDCYNGEPS